jgi:hypothetical protein
MINYEVTKYNFCFDIKSSVFRDSEEGAFVFDYEVENSLRSWFFGCEKHSTASLYKWPASFKELQKALKNTVAKAELIHKNCNTKYHSQL